MKLHRFYTPNTVLTHEFWFKDKTTLGQWTRVLRFRPGQQVVLFDGREHDRLYKITDITVDEAHLELVTDYKRALPKKNIYLFCSLLKKDKNDWVLQKCTELGVSHFIPLIADRSDKTGFNIERARRIVIEAAEQCGRSDIPAVRDAMHVSKALAQYADRTNLFICEQDSGEADLDGDSFGVFIGPEGGWSDTEKQLFKDQNLQQLNLHDFTLRAETAAISASVKLLQ